ncbi:hypothetical protein VIGAN_01259600 [Vigna angularis var. angularis]|uniref:Uncharacterized protein n=1 Tax=Vigna angularis var. angularis TaxID=157739 RepID=A0A0S3R2T0_PHAAN|nr:hypothetical protein VIGAN_01259600 [Vigna angularis var. angularis]
MSSRSSLVHHLHFEFSEHSDFNTSSPQPGITLCLLLSLRVDQSSPNPQKGWQKRSKRTRNTALDFNTME